MKKYISLLCSVLILSASYVFADEETKDPIAQENPTGDETEKPDDDNKQETISCDIEK